MRSALLSCVAWLGALQSWRGPFVSVEDTARLVGIASVLGTVTVLVYRLGVWRQEMENTKDSVGADVKAHREESSANFDRIERRLEAIDHMLAASAEDRARAARQQSRIERRLTRLEDADHTE
jgi:septal ring factor EnvC (AmiA/AmiB activator)